MSVKAPLIGRLGAEPDVKALPNGSIVVNLSIATSSRRKNRDTDKWEDVNVTWWRAHAFGDLAERLAANLTKGDPVIFYGEGYNRTYQTNEGEKKTILEFKIEHGGIDWRWSDKQIRPAAPPQSAPAPYYAGQQYGSPPQQQPQPAGPYYAGHNSGPAGPYDWSDEPPF
jgi:single-strand DNA-binding protein